MFGKLRRGFLPFRIERAEGPLIARAGLALPYEMARALKLPQVIDRELPPPGSTSFSGRCYPKSLRVSFLPLKVSFYLNATRELDIWPL